MQDSFLTCNDCENEIPKYADFHIIETETATYHVCDRCFDLNICYADPIIYCNICKKPIDGEYIDIVLGSERVRAHTACLTKKENDPAKLREEQME